MGSLRSKNRAVKYLLCTKDVFTKYTMVKGSKDKEAKEKDFIQIVYESNRNP